MGLIAVEGLRFYAHHGYYKEEQNLGGQYVVDVYLRKDLSAAARTDELEDTINYEEVYSIVREQMDIRAKLIEHLAQRILDSIIDSHNGLQYVKVRLSKLNPPLKGNVDRVYVTLEKELPE